MEVLQRTANRGSISTGSYEIDNSAAFGGANGIQFNPSSDGNQRTWTMSLWVKRSEIGVETTIFGAQNTAMVFMDPDWFRFHLYTGSTTYYYDTDNSGTVFRDTSAWYHFVFQCDTTQAVAANRTKLYINGALYTGARGGADTSANIPQNTEFRLNNNAVNFQVGYFYAGNEQLDGYLAEVNFTDGVANDADAFGEYDDNSGIWKPKAYAGSYGTNGFYLEFKESAASATGIGKDTSGNGHNFSTGGAYPAQATDTPTNNFCTFNALIPGAGIISEGATKFTNSTGNGWKSAVASMGAGTSGKWYAEFKFSTTASDNVLGQCPIDDPDLNRGEAGFAYYGSDTSLDESTGVYSNDGNRYIGGGAASYGVSYGTSDIMAIAIDMDNGKFYVAKNNTWMNSGNPTSGATGTGALDVRGATKPQSLGSSQYTANASMLCNFGGYTTISISSAASDENGYGTFEYAPPSGYYALCTKNLAEYG